jgi:uncharacterized protein YjiS (DUF1127 family)
MADISLHYGSTAHSSQPLARTLTSFGQVLATWRRRTRERRELTKLDHRAIRDLGLSPSDVHFEANKAFWQR